MDSGQVYEATVYEEPCIYMCRPTLTLTQNSEVQGQLAAASEGNQLRVELDVAENAQWS